MKKPQLITIGIAVFLVAVYFYVWPYNSNIKLADSKRSCLIRHPAQASSFNRYYIEYGQKKDLNPEQVIRLTTLENSISRGDVKNQQLKVYHQLAHFWNDSAGFFEPYACYEAEAARLENSEKTLTFAARLFLENLQE